jgi:hypothetical protein
MHPTIFKLCCVIFTLQALLSSIASGHNLRALNAQSQQDVLVICTGSETKWISAERYFDFGEIVEVEQPADTSDTHLLLACANTLAYDNKPVSLTALSIAPVAIYSLSNVSTVLQNQALVQDFYALASSRAPPHSILV